MIFNKSDEQLMKEKKALKERIEKLEQIIMENQKVVNSAKKYREEHTKVCPFGEYVFMQDGERIRSYIFRTRLYSNCKKLNIVVKSPHKVRKTYGSKLYDSDAITESFMIEQMGHTDITCLKKHYYYNRMDSNEKMNMLNQAAVL